MDAERKRKQKLYESMILQLNEVFPNHSLQVIMEAVKRAKLDFDLAMQYVLETPVELPRVTEPVTRAPELQPTVTNPTPVPPTEARPSEQRAEDPEEEPEVKRKKPSASALKRKVPQVKEMIPDASEEVILLKLAQVNGDVDKCILLLLEDPDAGTRETPLTGIEPLPSDSEEEGEDVSDDEIDSAGSFDPNDLADWDDHMMEEIDGWFVAPAQQPERRVDEGPNLLHKLYQELADEEIARIVQR